MKRPKTFKTVKQAIGSCDCVACCAAMAIGETLAYVKRRMRPTQGETGRYYPVSELLRLLGAMGIFTGLHFAPGRALSKEEDFSYSFSLQDFPAILLVEVVGSPMKHCVFWDGKHVRDPDSRLPVKLGLSNYKVLNLIPLCYMEEA